MTDTQDLPKGMQGSLGSSRKNPQGSHSLVPEMSSGKAEARLPSPPPERGLQKESRLPEIQGDPWAAYESWPILGYSGKRALDRRARRNGSSS
jgi:hypothetical protein